MRLARCVVDAYICQIFHVPGARRLRILARQWSYLDTLAKLEIKVNIYLMSIPKLTLTKDVFGWKG